MNAECRRMKHSAQIIDLVSAQRSRPIAAAAQLARGDQLLALLAEQIHDESEPYACGQSIGGNTAQYARLVLALASAYARMREVQERRRAELDRGGRQ